MGVDAPEERQQRGMDVEHPPRPALDEAGGQHAHEAGEADELDAARRAGPASSARSKLSRSGKALWSTAAVAIPACRARASPPASGRFDSTSDDLGGIVRARARPRSARPCWSRGPRSGWRRAAGHAERAGVPVRPDTLAPVCATTSPMPDRALARGAAARSATASGLGGRR